MSRNPDDNFELPVQEVSAACEALMFASGESISISKMEEVLNVDRKVIEDAMERLITDYNNNPWGGLLIRKIEDSYIMCTKPGMKKVLERLLQFCEPVRGKKYEADGTFSLCTGIGTCRCGGAGEKGRAPGGFHLRRRRHADDAFPRTGRQARLVYRSTF